MDLNEKCQMLPILTKRKTKWTSIKRENGHFTLPIPIYDEEVNEWIELFHKLKLHDDDYIENYKKIKEIPIDELSRDEILTIYTHYIDGERFFDGLIDGGLSSGRIEELGVRLNEITKTKNKIKTLKPTK